MRAAQEGNAHRRILLSTVGIVFLATPFRGSDAAKQAQWGVAVAGIMGEQTSRHLIDALHNSDKELQMLTQMFAEMARRDSIQLPVHCFYETKRTEILRRLLSPNWAGKISASIGHKTHKIVCYPLLAYAYQRLTQETGKLVAENSACLDTYERTPLDATHSLMNKFDGPNSPNFQLVKTTVKQFADHATAVLSRRRKNRKLLTITSTSKVRPSN